MLDLKADPNIPEENGNYPILTMMSQEKIFLFDILVAYGSKIDIRNKNGDSLIILASKNYDIIVKNST